jgi:hypothetical protein
MTCPSPTCRAVREAAEKVVALRQKACDDNPWSRWEGSDGRYERLATALAALPERGLRCPCGRGTCVPVPTCPACGEQWIGEDESKALDAATDPSVFAERRAKREAMRDALPEQGQATGYCNLCCRGGQPSDPCPDCERGAPVDPPRVDPVVDPGLRAALNDARAQMIKIDALFATEPEVRCPECKGRGWHPGDCHPREECGVCGGTGCATDKGDK